MIDYCLCSAFQVIFHCCFRFLPSVHVLRQSFYPVFYFNVNTITVYKDVPEQLALDILAYLPIGLPFAGASNEITNEYIE